MSRLKTAPSGVNPLPARDEDDTPRVGLGVTQAYGYGGVRYAGTVIAVERNGRTLVVQDDDTAVKPGQEGTFFGGNIEYDYFPNSNARTKRYTKRKDGRFRAEGDSSHYAARLSLGVRRQYEDPSL